MEIIPHIIFMSCTVTMAMDGQVAARGGLT